MSRGHNKPGPRRKKGDWVSLARGRANKHRTERGTVVCPHNHSHIVSASAFLTHLNVHGGIRA